MQNYPRFSHFCWSFCPIVLLFLSCQDLSYSLFAQLEITRQAGVELHHRHFPVHMRCCLTYPFVAQLRCLFHNSFPIVVESIPSFSRIIIDIKPCFIFCYHSSLQFGASFYLRCQSVVQRPHPVSYLCPHR